MLSEDQAALLAQATAHRDASTRSVATLEEAAAAGRSGLARMPWRDCGTEGEARLARDGISVRCLLREDGLPVDDPGADGVDALVARAY